MNACRLEKPAQAGEVDVAKPAWIVAEQHRSGNAAGMHDPAHVEALDRLVPAMRIRQIVREEGHAQAVEVQFRRRRPIHRHDPNAVRRKAPQHGSSDQSTDPGDKNRTFTHSAASAKRIWGVTTVAIRRTSSRSPREALRIVRPVWSIGKEPGLTDGSMRSQARSGAARRASTSTRSSA